MRLVEMHISSLDGDYVIVLHVICYQCRLTIIAILQLLSFGNRNNGMGFGINIFQRMSVTLETAFLVVKAV